MARQRSGKIVNIASTNARMGSGDSVCSSAAHSSIDSMTRAVAQGWACHGVNANALLCGPMADAESSPEESGERLRRMPYGRLARAEDLVGAAIFLSSDDAKFIAGESLVVDAGYTVAGVTDDRYRPEWVRAGAEEKK